MLFRLNYSTNFHLLTNQLDLSIKQCQSQISSQSRLLPPTEEKLSWLVLITAHVLSTTQTDDAVLCVQVFSLMMFTGNLFPHFLSPLLEQSFLTFLDIFHKTFLGQSNDTINQIHAQLSSNNSKMTGDQVLLVLVMNRVLAYLVNISDFSLLESTVNLFHTMTNIEYVVSQLHDVSSARYLLSYQRTGKFPLLCQTDPKFLPLRRKYFSSLTVMAAKNSKDFKDWFQNRLYDCMRLLDQGSDCRTELVFLCHDLRGVCSSFNHEYTKLMGWLHPFLMGLGNSLKIYNNDAHVCSAVLRFFLECTTNRFQRLHFDVTSPTGIYLFKGVCFACSSYASLALTKTASQTEYYSQIIKLTNYSLSCLNSALSSKYVNIAVFDVYKDTCLQDALQANLNLILSLPLDSLMSYYKLKKSSFTFLQILCSDHTDFVDAQSMQSVLSLMNIITSGIGDTDFANVASVCMSIESLFTQTLRKLAENTSTGSLSVLVSQYPHILYEIVVAIVNVVIAQPDVHIWTFARPFLSLLLVNKQFLVELEKYVSKYFADASLVSAQFQLLSAALGESDGGSKERFIEAFSNFSEALSSLQKVNSVNM